MGAEKLWLTGPQAKAIEKHLNTKLTITLENFRSIFEDWNDDQRMEIIKSLIWTANNAKGFARRVQTLLDSKHFIDDIDWDYHAEIV